MRIDAHQHFWDLARFDYGWMPPGSGVLRRNYLPEDLAPILARNRFEGSIVVQANTDPREADWLLSLAAGHDFIRGVVGWVDLEGAELGSTLDRLQQDARFVGVRHPVHDEPDVNWLLRPTVLTGLRELARRGLPYDLLLRPAHLPLIPRIADAVPDLRLVMDHIAKPLIKERRLDGWAEDMARAAAVPHVFCKLSGMITEADPQGWTAGHLRPYVQHVLQIFGPERLMFGSDWPVCRLAGEWKSVLAAFTQACGPLPQATREQLLGGTAVTFYRLPLQGRP